MWNAVQICISKVVFIKSTTILTNKSKASWRSLCFLLRSVDSSRIRQLTRTSSHKLENLIDQDHRKRDSQHQEPFVQAERDNAEDIRKERDVEDQKVQAE